MSDTVALSVRESEVRHNKAGEQLSDLTLLKPMLYLGGHHTVPFICINVQRRLVSLAGSFVADNMELATRLYN